LIVKHSYVGLPSAFGADVVVRRIRDKNCAVCSSDNYRGITVTKILESCILQKFGDLFSNHDLQFGFKKGIGCSAAFFSMEQIVKYFTDKGSSIYLSALDASKAFDRIVINLSYIISGICSAPITERTWAIGALQKSARC